MLLHIPWGWWSLFSKDCYGIKESRLHDKVEILPAGYVCIADCAYEPTGNRIPIFGVNFAVHKEMTNSTFVHHN